ncbi:hypothetical protein EXIGLDRAFT_720465 [Exidia glandulosa HHB12029]|uniref:RNI-like protein n=1 Tax=Exidia glandulosa HHB12029 TaxID=1314781 RepID=A0A165NK34_EXIGL|nr:hypothetical protein EXIGLDRAFT_720465 [Exidia glandulosa HHB12029]
MARTPTGDTEPALISLVNTLAAFHKKGSAIPKNVRALHLAIGRTSGRGYGERDAYLVHGSPDLVAYAVQLCPGLVHFSLTIGAIQAEEGDDSEVFFEPKDIAMLRRNRTLQQLSIATMDDDDLIERADLSPPPLTAANQLVRIFAPTLTFLHIESHGEEGGTLEQMDDDINALPALPKLRTAALHGASDLIKTAVRTGAPNLESVSGLLGDVPTTVKHLQCSVGTTAASLMAYTRLETLDMRGCADPVQLLSGALPPGLRELQFGSQSFNSPDAVKQLKSALRRVKTIKSVCVFHNRYSGGASNFTPPKLHVPVHVVYESYVTDDIIPCPYNTAVGATAVSKAKPSKR